MKQKELELVIDYIVEYLESRVEISKNHSNAMYKMYGKDSEEYDTANSWYCGQSQLLYELKNELEH